MTVASTTNRKTYTGDNVSTSFATSPVIFYLTSDLQVRVTVIATGVSTLLTENTHYTVSGGAATGATGTVNLAGGSSPHGALLSTEKLVILRVLPLTQASDFVNNSNSDAEVLEAALDKLTDVDQQIQEQADRSIRFASGDVSGSVTEIPDVTTRALKTLGFDSSGNLTTILMAVGGSLIDLATSIGSSLIGFIQSGTGAVARTVQEDMRERVSVTQFMSAAQKADVRAYGFTLDVTAAFQAAHDSLGSNGGEIDIPAGGYLMNQTTQAAQFTISKSNVTLRGRGWASQLKHTGTGALASSVNNAVVMVRPLTGNISNTVLKDFRITGPTANNGTGIVNWCCLGICIHDGPPSAHTVSDVLVQGIYIEKMEGIAFLLTAKDATSNCKRIKFSQCWAMNGRNDGFNDLASDANEDITVEDCYAFNLDGYGMEMSTAKGLTLSGNRIVNCVQAGIGIEYGATNSSKYHVSIIGNQIHDIPGTAPGISLGQSVNPDNTLIEGNVISRIGGNGIVANLNPTNVRIIGNVIKDVGGGAGGAALQAGILGFTGATNCKILNNDITSAGAGYTMVDGINIVGSSTTILVRGNDIQNETNLKYNITNFGPRVFRGLAGSMNRTAVTNTGAAEQDGITYTLPANTLQTPGQYFVLRADGVTAANANNKQAKLVSNGTTVLDSGAVAANNKPWSMEMTVTYGFGTRAIATLEVVANGFFNGAALATTYNSINNNDLTAALVFKMRITGPTANSDITNNHLSVEFKDSI